MEKFVIFTTGWKAAPYIKSCMMSVQQQNYENYIHIVIDDCSNDNNDTFNEMLKFKTDKVILIQNHERKFQIRNAVETIHNYAEPCDVFLQLDADDYLYDNTVLPYVNNIYKRHRCWFTYGGLVPTNPNRPFPTQFEYKGRDFRNAPWVFTHLRTMKFFLFQKIKLESLKYKDGRFLTHAPDRAITYPVLEMCPSNKIHFCTRPLYYYRTDNPLSEHVTDLVTQTNCMNYVKSMEPYQVLDESVEEICR